MNKEKLNEVAKHFAAWETINSSDPNNNYYCKWGFIKGAQWLMQQPFAERLTEEEKEKLTPANRYVLETIFGSDLFSKK